MNVVDAAFEPVAEPPVPGWKVRVTVVTTEPTERAAPVVGVVGEVPLAGIVSRLDGPGVIGFLADEPPDGAELKIGYADEGLVETGITYERHIA